MEHTHRQRSLAERRASTTANDDNGQTSPTRLTPLTLITKTPVPALVEQSLLRPQGPPTPNMTTPSTEPLEHQDSTVRPPTPAESPGLYHTQPDWSGAVEDENKFLQDVKNGFTPLNSAARQRVLSEMLRLCNSSQLSFVHQFVSPLLKKDPFTSLPEELCLRVRTAFHAM